MNRETPSPAPAWLSSLSELLRSAERLALLTIFAFGLSVLVNALVFDSWGHTFLALAAPTDVLMSGLCIGIIPALMAGSYAAAYALVISRRSRLAAWWAFWWTLVAWSLIASRFVGYGPPAARLWWVVVVPAWAVGGLIATVDLRAQGAVVASGVLSRLANVARARMRDLTGIGLGLVLLAFSTAMVWTNGQIGYFSWPLRLADEDAPPNCEGRVLWSGERALLVDCGKALASDVQVLYRIEGVRLIRDPRKRPDPSPPRIVQDARAWLTEQTVSTAPQSREARASANLGRGVAP